MRPRVTIIIPTYNRAESVSRAIDSVLGQTHENLDILVVDDGSTDDTPQVLRRYDEEHRVRVIRLARNRGVTGAKNAGLANLSAETAYFGILDSDDALVPAAIDTIARVFESDDDRYSQVFAWGLDDASGALTGRMPYREGPVTYDDALAGRFGGDFWHLASARLLGGKRFDERASGAESSVWWPLLNERDGWLVRDVVLHVNTSGSDRVSAVQYSRSTATGRMWACHAGLAAVAEDLRQRYPRRYGDWLVELAKWAALAGERSRARAAAREGVRYARSRRSILMAVLVLLPSPLLRGIATWRANVGRAATEAPRDPGS